MTIDDALLTEYALGTLDRKTCQELERMLDSDSVLERRLIELQNVFQVFSTPAFTQSPSDSLKTRLFKSLEPATRFAGFATRLAELFDLSEKRIHTLLAAVDKSPQGPWVESGVSNVLFMHFEGGPAVATADCGLVRMDAGCLFPTHTHLGTERSMVLQGEVEENGSRIYYPGDMMAVQAAGDAHTIRSLGEEPLILAVVLHGGFEILDV